MVNDLVWLIARLNLVLAAAIALVLILRAPARRMFGARLAYALWLMPVLAAAMCFAPARIIHVFVSPPTSTTAVVHHNEPWLFSLWAGGALLSLIILALRQFRFTRSLGRLFPRDDLGSDVRGAESAAQGPAVIGVLRPVIVTPSDFDQRFDAEERRIVLAHERAHLDQGDPWINAVVVLLQCVNWFNPFMHIAARALRIDQELACDAAVLAQSEGARRRYAETMLKTQLAATAPIGCAWPPSSAADLKERIAMLKQALPSRTQRLVGVSTLAIATVAACAAAWAVQPVRIVATVAPGAPTTLAPAPLPPDAYAPPVDGTPALAQETAADPVEGRAALAQDDDLEGADDADGESGRAVIDARHLTPEERAQVRAALAAARDQIRAAREQAEGAREQREGAREEAEAAREQARAAMDAARPQIEAAARAAADGERQVDVVRARIAVREAQRQIEQGSAARDRMVTRAAIDARRAEVQAAIARSPEVQVELRAAREQVRRAAEQARVEGDAQRIDALERAQRALEAVDQERGRAGDER